MDAVTLLNSLPAEYQECLTRVRHWLEPIPETAEDLLEELVIAKHNARTASDRLGFSDPYEQIHRDLVHVHAEVERRVRGVGI